MNTPATSKRSRRDSARNVAVEGAIVTACTLAAGLAFVYRRADLFSTPAALIAGEQGNVLYRASKILSGARIYTDFASQYGPLGSYVFAAFAWLAGINGQTLALYNAVIAAASMGLCFVLIRRFNNRNEALLYCASVVAWTLPFPFGAGAYGHVEYIALERFLALLALLVYAGKPSYRNAFICGSLFGLMQITKFGGALYLCVAIVLVETVQRWPARRDATLLEAKTHFVGRLSALIGTLLLVELIYVCILFGMVPTNIAIEAAWPQWIRNAYPPFRLPTLFAALTTDPVALVTHVLPQYIGVALGMIGVFLLFAKSLSPNSWRTPWRPSSRPEMAIAVLGLAYVGQIGTYMAHQYLIIQYSWMLAAAGSLIFYRLPRRGKLLVAVPALGPLLITGKMFFLPSAHAVPLRIPSRPDVTLYSSDSLASELLNTVDWRQASDPSTPDQFFLVVQNSSAGGFHFFLNRNYSLRSAIIFPHYLRPYDEPDLIKKAPGLLGVLVDFESAPPASTLAEALRPLFSKLVCTAILARGAYSSHHVTKRYVYYHFDTPPARP